MIRINLLGGSKASGGEATDGGRRGWSAGAGVAGLAVAGVLLGSSYWHAAGQYTAATQQILQLQTEKARLQQVESQVLQLQAEQATLQRQLAIVDALQSNRSGGEELLEAVANSVVRTDQLWLTSLTRKGDDVTFGGEAGSVNAVASFLSVLRHSGYFDHVEMKEAKEDDSNAQAAIFTFSMTAKMAQTKSGAGGPGKS